MPWSDLPTQMLVWETSHWSFGHWSWYFFFSPDMQNALFQCLVVHLYWQLKNFMGMECLCYKMPGRADVISVNDQVVNARSSGTVSLPLILKVKAFHNLYTWEFQQFSAESGTLFFICSSHLLVIRFCFQTRFTLMRIICIMTLWLCPWCFF